MVTGHDDEGALQLALSLNLVQDHLEKAVQIFDLRRVVATRPGAARLARVLARAARRLVPRVVDSLWPHATVACRRPHAGGYHEGVVGARERHVNEEWFIRRTPTEQSDGVGSSPVVFVERTVIRELVAHGAHLLFAKAISVRLPRVGNFAALGLYRLVLQEIPIHFVGVRLLHDILLSRVTQPVGETQLGLMVQPIAIAAFRAALVMDLVAELRRFREVVLADGNGVVASVAEQRVKGGHAQGVIVAVARHLAAVVLPPRSECAATWRAKRRRHVRLRETHALRRERLHDWEAEGKLTVEIVESVPIKAPLVWEQQKYIGAPL
mmetsp:Transcript_84240/g.235048  ORF Transcript_84240/g.235048 Transcript_84240/m.235048 type:complete len:324 (+) Transcript_84240:960-1931(+)